MDNAELASLTAEFNPPMPDVVVPSGLAGTSFDAFVADSKKNSPYFNQLPTGEYMVKFLGAEMVDTKYGITPRYKFVVDGVEKTLDSKAKSLHCLAGRQGQTMKIIKSMTQDGKNAYIVR